jgi:hypothetical protein
MQHSITSLESTSKLGGSAIQSAFAALGIDDDLKPHVLQHSPGVIFRLEMLGLSTGPLQCIRELRQRVCGSV